jgi:glycosyltransferase involved in cell wall biosynthesis
MNVLMLSNTYIPFVGGVERSVSTLAEELRKRGHRVKIVAPTFPNTPKHERDIIRVPALQQFNGTDFSVEIPVPGILTNALRDFPPDIVHSHHPYLLGGTALRVAASREIPVVFTFHTFYERYTHYVPGDSPALRRFVAALATGYANLVDHVVAPSESVRQELVRRGVLAPMTVIPSGIDLRQFASGTREHFRSKAGIPRGAKVVGLVSRMAPEKNIAFLAESVARLAKQMEMLHFFAFGSGPSTKQIQKIFHAAGIEDRLHLFGTVQGRELVDAYHSLDTFAFSSHTETQGMVLAEAMAAGVPVVALDAPGSRDVVHDEHNGRLIAGEDTTAFIEGIRWTLGLSRRGREHVREECLATARLFSKERCVEKVLAAYHETLAAGYSKKRVANSHWERARHLIRTEWDIVANLASAASAAMNNG